MVRFSFLAIVVGFQPVIAQFCGSQSSCSSCLSASGCVWNFGACVNSGTVFSCGNDASCTASIGLCPAIGAPAFGASTFYTGASTIIPTGPAYTISGSAASAIYARPSVVPSIASTPLYAPPIYSPAPIYNPIASYPAAPAIASYAPYNPAPVVASYPIYNPAPVVASYPVYNPAPVVASYPVYNPAPVVASYPVPATTSVVYRPSAAAIAPVAPVIPYYSAPSVFSSPSYLPTAASTIYSSTRLAVPPVYASTRVAAGPLIRYGNGYRDNNGGLFDINGQPVVNTLRNNAIAGVLDPLIPGIAGTVSTLNDVNLIRNTPQFIGNVVNGQGYNRNPVLTYARNDFYADQVGRFVPGLDGPLNQLNKLNLYANILN